MNTLQYQIINFDSNMYSLKNIVCDNIDIDPDLLEYIHLTDTNVSIFFNNTCEIVYKKIIKHIIKPTITGHRLYFNKQPLLVIHKPNDTTALRINQNDINIKQYSILIPLTTTFDTNAIWLNKKPIDLNPNNILLFNTQDQDFYFVQNLTNQCSVFITFSLLDLKDIISCNINSDSFRKDYGII